MPNIVKIPESLQFYFENEQQASAIQQVIELESIPTGLTWKEVEYYNIAKVSALSTQLDYWRLMRELWDATWGKALADSAYKEVDPDYYDADYSMESVWDNPFCKVHEYNDITLCFFCYSEDTDLQLGFYVESPDGQRGTSNYLGLSDGWVKEIENERLTQKGLVDIKAKSEIDIEPLINLANEVILKLKSGEKLNGLL